MHRLSVAVFTATGRRFSTQVPQQFSGQPIPPGYWPSQPAPPPPAPPPPAMPRYGMQASGLSLKSPPLKPSDYIHKTPLNLGICIVPQGQLWVVERLGKYFRTLLPGLAVLIPIIDRVAYVHSSKESAFSIPNQSAITKDNVIVEIDGVMFMKVIDAFKASYHIDNAIYNLIQMAMTTMRSEIGKLTLDSLFEERSSLNANIVANIQQDAAEWGVQCKRYEIKDIIVSDLVRQSMDLQAEAERRKRKHILESEGEMTAARNQAEGQKLATLLLADAERMKIIKHSEGEATAIKLRAQATAEALQVVSNALAENHMTPQAIQLRVAEQYINAFSNLAKAGNTLILPTNVSDPAAIMAQALGIYGALQTKTADNTVVPTPRPALPNTSAEGPSANVNP